MSVPLLYKGGKPVISEMIFFEYDSTKTQTLKNIGGVIQWVTES